MSDLGPGPVGPSAGPPPIPHQSPDSQAPASGFAQMLGPTATPKQIAKAMAQVINSMIMEIKKEQAKAHETARKIKNEIEGKE